MLERLVLKRPIQRTSQRVKWTSGARDMNFPGYDGAGYFFLSLETLAGDDGGERILFPEMMGVGGVTFPLISKPWLEMMGEGGRTFWPRQG